MKLSKTQMNILENLKGGCTLVSKDQKCHLKFSNGMMSPVLRSTFHFLYYRRFIDPNGLIFGESHYKISDKGLEALK